MDITVETNELKHSRVTLLEEENRELKAYNAHLLQQVQYLLEQMRIVNRREFGTSSEKTAYDQSSLFSSDHGLCEAVASAQETVEVKQYDRKRRRTRNEYITANLPVEIVEHKLPESDVDCPQCRSPLHIIGKEIHREIKIIPAKASVVEHVRYVYACRACERDADTVPVVKASTGRPVIAGSMCSPETAAHIMVQKFVTGVPLYRQEAEWKRNGVGLTRQVMSNWLLRCSQDWLEPIYQRLHERLLEHEVLHADETTLQVLKEPGKCAQSKSYMWLYRTSGDAEIPIVLYDYQPDRRAARPMAFLENFKGYLHTDGYPGYHNLSDKITVVGCWAHARRRFNEALMSLKPDEREGSGPYYGKQYCDMLFAVERTVKDLSPTERHKKRQALANPILDAFLSWLNQQRLIKNAFGRAVQYTLSQWQYLVRYLLDGRLEISNNRAERSIKTFVISRKNFIFANSVRGARASAVICSLIETAKETGLNPFEYLAYVFKVAPNLGLANNPDAVNMIMPAAYLASNLVEVTSS